MRCAVTARQVLVGIEAFAEVVFAHPL